MYNDHRNFKHHNITVSKQDFCIINLLKTIFILVCNEGLENQWEKILIFFNKKILLKLGRSLLWNNSFQHQTQKN